MVSGSLLSDSRMWSSNSLRIGIPLSMDFSANIYCCYYINCGDNIIGHKYEVWTDIFCCGIDKNQKFLINIQPCNCECICVSMYDCVYICVFVCVYVRVQVSVNGCMVVCMCVGECRCVQVSVNVSQRRRLATVIVWRDSWRDYVTLWDNVSIVFISVRKEGLAGILCVTL